MLDMQIVYFWKWGCFTLSWWNTSWNVSVAHCVVQFNNQLLNYRYYNLKPFWFHVIIDNFACTYSCDAIFLCNLTTIRNPKFYFLIYSWFSGAASSEQLKQKLVCFVLIKNNLEVIDYLVFVFSSIQKIVSKNLFLFRIISVNWLNFNMKISQYAIHFSDFYHCLCCLEHCFNGYVLQPFYIFHYIILSQPF